MESYRGAELRRELRRTTKGRHPFEGTALSFCLVKALEAVAGFEPT